MRDLFRSLALPLALASGTCTKAPSAGRDAGVLDAPDSGSLQAPQASDAGRPCPPILGTADEPDAGDQKFHRIPVGYVGVAFAKSEHHGVDDVSLVAAVTAMNQAEDSRRKAAPQQSHEAWFFDAFDDASLFFSVAHYEPNPRGGRPVGTYKVLRRLRVRRSSEALAALGVESTVAQYEVGICGIRAGMSAQQVRYLLGPAPETQELGPVGAFRYEYPGLSVGFIHDHVAYVNR